MYKSNTPRGLLNLNIYIIGVKIVYIIDDMQAISLMYSIMVVMIVSLNYFFIPLLISLHIVLLTIVY